MKLIFKFKKRLNNWKNYSKKMNNSKNKENKNIRNIYLFKKLLKKENKNFKINNLIPNL